MDKAEAEALIAECVEEDEGGFGVFTDYDVPTKSGCTLPAFREVYPTASVENLKRATREEIMAVYRTRFLDRLSHVPDFLLPAAFSCAVNVGLGKSHILIQLMVSRITDRPIAMDGIAGPKTGAEIARLAEVHGEEAALTAFLIIWSDHYYCICRQNEQLKIYMEGWLNRVRRYLPRR